MMRTVLTSGRTGCKLAFLGWITFTLVAPRGHAQQPTGATPNRAPLQENAFYPLPLTSVRPTGWLLRELQIQANGLSGHLDEFWPDLGPDSGWLGGKGESWERGPYYLDGLVPLAYLTGDERLIAKAKKWVDWTLENQQSDGWIGPASMTDWWPNYVMLKVLTQYQEATGDARVIPLMQKYFAFQAHHLDDRPLKEWELYRWHDEVLSILWLYNRTGDSSLLDLARRLHNLGHDWETQFADFRYTRKTGKEERTFSQHGVNNAMAMKAAAVWWLLTGNQSDRESLNQMLSALDRYHGQAFGLFSADEHYAGLDPSQGTELCAVVEAMFSLETDIAILGDPALADRLERIAYNALPGTLTDDLWGHQYDQQANQVMVSVANRRWSTNGPESNIFGLEPNFGCCTANMHQGWPKFVANLWMATADGGLAAVAYGPSEVSTQVGNGVPISIAETTDYPFRETVTLVVTTPRSVKFPLVLRAPAWAAGSTVALNGTVFAELKAGGFYRMERKWKTGDTLELHFPMKVANSTWYHNSVAVERGPLVFSLKIGENWSRLRQVGPATDWEVYPTTPWNYALVTDPKNPEPSFTVTELPVGRQPFSLEGAPVEIAAKGRRLPGWQVEDDSAGPLPLSPVTSDQRVETISLVPYGAAKLRITVFPFTKN
ncbi:MAG: beta-L-arabinofuranosidase domain-containing protein [Terriglobia bacterium]